MCKLELEIQRSKRDLYYIENDDIQYIQRYGLSGFVSNITYSIVTYNTRLHRPIVYNRPQIIVGPRSGSTTTAVALPLVLALLVLPFVGRTAQALCH